MKFPDELVEVVRDAIMAQRYGELSTRGGRESERGEAERDATAALTAFVGWAGKPENVTEKVRDAFSAAFDDPTLAPETTHDQALGIGIAAAIALGEP